MDTRPAPPHDLDAECSTLGAMVVNPSAIETARRVVSVDDFYHETNGLVFRAICELCDADVQVDVVTLSGELERRGELERVGGKPYIHSLVAMVPVAASVRRYAEIVNERASRRAFLRHTDELRDLVERDDRHAEDLWQEAAQLTAARAETAVARFGAASLVCLADVEPVRVEYLWPLRIARGRLTILFGDAGLGKTHAALDVLARVTVGARWPNSPPDDMCAPQGNVVIMTAEDDLRDTIRPRLDAAGADVRRCFALPAVANFDGKARRVFSITCDTERLEAEIRRVNAIAVMVDPLTAFLAGSDAYKQIDVRVALSRISDVAARTGAAILCIMHPNRGSEGRLSALYRLSGSLAFGAAPRSVLAVATDEKDDDEKRRLLVHVKSNIGALADGLGFRIIGKRPDTCDSRVEWDTEPVDMSADEAFGKTRRTTPQVLRAMSFLRRALATGEPYPAANLLEEAQADAIPAKALRKAANLLGVVRSPAGFQGGWTWQIPDVGADQR